MQDHFSICEINLFSCDTEDMSQAVDEDLDFGVCVILLAETMIN